MAYIRVDSAFTIFDGAELSFKAPADISQVSGLRVYYSDSEGILRNQQFKFADANRQDITDLNGVFSANAMVKVILDTDDGLAFVQNADTNAYLEGKFSAINTKTASIESDIKNVKTSNSTLAGEVNNLETTASSLRKDLGDLQQNYTTTTTKLTNDIAGVSSTASSLSGDVSNLKSTTSSLSTDVSGLKTTTSGLSSSVSSLNSTTSSLSTDVSGLKSTTSTLNTNVNNLTTKVNGMASTIGSTSTPVDQIYATSIGTSSKPVSSMNATTVGATTGNITTVNATTVNATSIGTTSKPVSNIYATTLGSSSKPLDAVYTRFLDAAQQIGSVEEPVEELNVRYINGYRAPAFELLYSGSEKDDFTLTKDTTQYDILIFGAILGSNTSISLAVMPAGQQDVKFQIADDSKFAVYSFLGTKISKYSGQGSSATMKFIYGIVI